MNLLLIIFLFLSNKLFAETQLFSPNVKKIKFNINTGVVFSVGQESPSLVVLNQLKYMFGILNEVDAGVDFPEVKIDIILIEGNEIHYKASGAIAWDKKRTIPHYFTLPLPRYGDSEGLTLFYNKYMKSCSKKPGLISSFFNYYRPNHVGCPIKNYASDDTLQIVAVFEEADILNKNHEPNYKKMFEDNILEMTVVMTKDNPANAQDVSVFDFQGLCDYFSNAATVIKKTSSECHTEGQANGKIIKSHLFLIDNFDIQPDLFLQKINNYLLSSDIVSYNGHSGLGQNIYSFMQFYPSMKDKYQIIFFNSCDTYGYFKNDFFNNRNVDVILNATPNFFGTFSASNKNIVENILLNSNFDQVLKGFPVEQHSILLYKNNL